MSLGDEDAFDPARPIRRAVWRLLLSAVADAILLPFRVVGAIFTARRQQRHIAALVRDAAPPSSHSST